MRAAGEIVGGRYQIERHLGSGGMGEVYLALDSTLGRRVAVKVLPAKAECNPTARERLRREARAAAGLDHPFICKIHEVGEADGESFIVMEFIDGDTLHQLTSKGPVPVRQVLDIAHALSQALEEAHGRGITHRDLKPGNIMVTRQGHVKVLDFGLAKQTATAAATDSTGGGTVLTDPGTRVGTPAYMSPEQILGGPVDPRSDIFSLGVILHEIVSGAHPFKRDTPAETMAAVLRDPPSGSGRDLEAVPGLRDAIHRMLSKACAERYQTMGELKAEIESLRERSWLSTPPATAASHTHAAAAERTPFVARDAELGELRRALDQMLLGQGGIVLIGGEPGVGKTRLVRELQREARLRGCLTLTGHCYELEGAPPFVPFAEYMEQAARLVPQGLRNALGDGAAEIAAIVPSLRRLYPDIPPQLEVPPDQQRRLRFTAFLDFVLRSTLKSPSVVLFDDLHWADEPTLQLIEFLAPHLATARTLFVGTYRDVELDVKKPFARTLESLLRQRLARRISLRRLAEDDVELMLARLSGAPPPSSVVRVVFQETEGNAFFVEEVYQHLSEEGRLFDDAGAWRHDLRADTLNVPESVKLVIGRRLERLGDDARKILTAAAVIGRTFPLDLLQAIVETNADGVLDSVEEAERASLVAAHSGREARYGFVHELVRTTLITGLSLPRRQRLHLKIADAIEQLRASTLETHASMLAHHLYQAGAAADLDRTAGTLMKAARQGQRSGAFEDVLEITDNLFSLDLVADHPQLAVARESRGLALWSLGRRDQAHLDFEAAFQTFARLKDAGGIERTTMLLGSSRQWQGDNAGACELFRRGLEQLPPSALAARLTIRAQAIPPLATVLRFDEADSEIREMTRAAADLDDPLLTAKVLIGEAFLWRAVANFEQQVRCSTRALELLPPAAEFQRVDLGWNHTYGLYYLGRIDDAEAVADWVEAGARRVGHLFALWAMSLIRPNMRVIRGGDIEAAIADHAKISSAGWDFVNQLLTGIWNAYLGNARAALAGLEALVATQPRQHYLAGPVDAALFAAFALVGDRAGAQRHFAAAQSWLPQDARFNSHGRWSAGMSVITGLALLDDRDRLAELDWLGKRLAAHPMPIDSLSLGPNSSELCAGLTANAAGDFERAQRHYETALQLARDIPHRLLEPTVQYWYGRLDLEQRRNASARARLEASIAAFTALKMPLHLERATRALREVVE